MNNKTYIIAELSANHGNDIEIAKKTILAMKESGADAVKVQTYTADTITMDCNSSYFKISGNTLWDGRTLYDLYKEAYMPWEWQPILKEFSNEIGIDFFSSPFDQTAVDFLENINVPIYKIASFEITDIPLIEYTASMKKPMIISTGIATLGDIDEAVKACRRVGNNDITLLKCTSEYPAKVEDANIVTINNLKETFNVKVGLSDHTLGSDVAIAAVALGAEVIEKHFILDKNIGGPDADFSMTPDSFSSMVESIRNVEKALGRVDYELTEKKQMSRHYSRSLFVSSDIKKGDIFTELNIRSIRPGVGLHPKYLNDILGKAAVRDISKGLPLDWSMIGRAT